MKYKTQKENNNFIYKFQKDDVNERLISILGDDFKKYRENFNKTQDYLNTKFIPDFPISVYLEAVNRCNLNCIMCYKKHHTYPRTELNLNIFEKIINECRENKLPALTLGLGSEILIYKDIKKVMNMVGEAGIIDVFFGTNGTLLNDEIIELIVKNRFTRVEISLDAATPGTYAKVRRGAPPLEIVEENINKLIASRKKANSSLPVIRLCFVVMDINKHETQLFIDKWKDKADYIDFQRYFDISFMDSPIEIKQEEVSGSFCSSPFHSLSVWADGKITPCCHYLGKRMVLGNIYENSLKEIWQGKKINEIREQIANNRMNSVCRKCMFYRDKNFEV